MNAQQLCFLSCVGGACLVPRTAVKVAFKGMANWERGGREGYKAALGDFIQAERAGSQGTSGSNTL